MSVMNCFRGALVIIPDVMSYRDSLQDFRRRKEGHVRPGVKNTRRTRRDEYPGLPAEREDLFQRGKLDYEVGCDARKCWRSDPVDADEMDVARDDSTSTIAGVRRDDTVRRREERQKARKSSRCVIRVSRPARMPFRRLWA